jgi:hypothetical protein
MIPRAYRSPFFPLSFLARFLKTYDDVTRPEVGKYGKEYSAFLEKLVDQSFPAFMCHYYNFYFAHTAGGRMIGKKMSSVLLDGYELHFYQVRVGP